MKSKYFWGFIRAYITQVNISDSMIYLSAIVNELKNKNNIKVEIAVVVVHKEMSLSGPENIHVYEALARFARSRIYLQLLC